MLRIYLPKKHPGTSFKDIITLALDLANYSVKTMPPTVEMNANSLI
jgi:hypothetical protein